MEDFGGGSEGMAIPSGVYTMEDMKDYGRSNGVCPYFLARLMLAKANIVIYSYHVGINNTTLIRVLFIHT